MNQKLSDQERWDENEDRWQGLRRGTILGNLIQKQLYYVGVTDRRATSMITISIVLIPFMLNFIQDSCYRWPAALMLVALVISFVTAIFSLFPQNPSGGAKHLNLFHFRDIAQMDEVSYLEAFNRILNDEEEPGPLLVTDIYRMARYVLNPKLRLLSISYTVFMIGLILAIAVFLTLLFTGSQFCS